jgi:O-antigen ligase
MVFFLLLYLGLVLIRPQDYPALIESLGTMPLLPIVLALALLAWLLSRRPANFQLPQYPLLAAFILVMMLSRALNGWLGGAVAQAIDFLPVFVAFMLFAHASMSPRTLRLLMAFFVLCAVVISLHGIEQEQLGYSWTGVELSQGTRIQYVGIFNDPNDLGMLFVTCLPMALLLARRGGARRLFWWAGAAILIYGIYLTNSRGTLLALALLLGLYVWRRWGKIAAALFGGVGLVGLMMLPSRLSELDVDEESAAGRIDAWYEGLQMFLSSPIHGVGAGTFDDHHHMVAHNSYIHVLAETGALGFTLWLTFIGYGFVMMMTIMRHRPTLPDAQATATWQNDRGTALTLFLSQCAFFFAAFFLSRSYVILLYLLAALVAGHYAGTRARFPSLPAFPLASGAIRWGLFSMAAIVGLYVVVRVLLAMS